MQSGRENTAVGRVRCRPTGVMRVAEEGTETRMGTAPYGANGAARHR
jgi:hypothetical protein